MQTRAVRVGHVSDLASEREIHEFFSFSGEIEHIEIRRFIVLSSFYSTEIGQTLTALEVPKKLFHSQESDDVLNSEVDSSVSSKFHPYNYQVTSQVTATNSLNSAQASQYEDAESAYNHQASSKFGSFFDLQPPGMDKFDGLSVPYYPVPISSAARKEPNQPFKLTIREDPVPVLDNNTDRGSNMDSKLIDLNARPQRIHGEASNDQTGLMGKTLLEFQSNKGDVLPAHKFGTRDVVVLKLNKADLGSPPSGRGVVYRRKVHQQKRSKL